MKKMIAAALASATLMTGAAYATQQTPQDRPMRPDPLAQADTNKDGVITREEMLADMTAHFTQLDTNKDGKISADERAASARPMGGQRGGGMMSRMMERMDTDGDGMISLDEQRAMSLRRFDRMDTNADGKIDQAERDAIRNRMGGRRGAGARGGDMPPPPAEAPVPPSGS